MQQECS